MRYLRWRVFLPGFVIPILPERQKQILCMEAAMMIIPDVICRTFPNHKLNISIFFSIINGFMISKLLFCTANINKMQWFNFCDKLKKYRTSWSQARLPYFCTHAHWPRKEILAERWDLYQLGLTKSMIGTKLNNGKFWVIYWSNLTDSNYTLTQSEGNQLHQFAANK